MLPTWIGSTRCLPYRSRSMWETSSSMPRLPTSAGYASGSGSRHQLGTCRAHRLAAHRQDERPAEASAAWQASSCQPASPYLAVWLHPASAALLHLPASHVARLPDPARLQAAASRPLADAAASDCMGPAAHPLAAPPPAARHPAALATPAAAPALQVPVASHPRRQRRLVAAPAAL